MQGIAKDYKTKTFITGKKLPKIMGNNQYKAKSIVGLDVGYSSTKGIGGDRAYCMPSIIKPVRDVRIIGELKDTDVIMEDHATGTKYYVGGFAYEQMTSADIKKLNDELLYDRYWYQSDIFRIMAAVGIGLGLPDNYDKTDIYIQTGLPCEYMDRDREEVIAKLLHPYSFSLQVGNTEPKEFTFTPKNVEVMEQPQGTLFGMMHNAKGELIPDRAKLLKTNTVIHDVGFGTEDDYSIRGNTNNFHSTYLDTSMRAVFEAVLDEVNSELPSPVQVFELQKYLERGAIRYFDRGSKSNKEIRITELLNKHNERLNKKAIERLMRLCDDFVEVDTLIVTGGTGESRIGCIREMLKDMDVEVLSGNENDPSLPFTFSNVLGYYMRAYNKLSRDMHAPRQRKE